MASSSGEAVAQVVGESRPRPQTRLHPPSGWRRFLANRWASAGAIVVVVIVIVAVLAPLLPLRDPNGTQPARRLSPPLSPGYVLGADHLGRDLLSRVAWGARISLTVGVLSTGLAAGATEGRIVRRHVLPNILAPVLVFVSMNIGWMITETAGLSFIGLGAQPPAADWGTMLADGRQFITVASHVAAIPGLALFVLVLGLNLAGDGLREAFDPRLR